MRIIGKNTIVGKLDLSALERLGDRSSIESYPFHLTVKAGYIIDNIEERFCGLISIQNALNAGYIDLEMTFSDCDNIFIKGIPGYDSTKKQILTSINGVIGWINAKDCAGADA